MRRTLRGALRSGVLGLLLCLSGSAARAADILLDAPVRLSGLICFPSRSDPTKYYYAPLRARLATGANGLPQFSFLRWVDAVESDAPEESIEAGVGGGIVHAVVKLGLSDEEVDEARGELSRMRPGATLVGPVIFSSGTFALITSFRPEDRELVRSLVGVGEAPVIEGAQAAISLALTRRGAQILWESFHTATPDISFLFSLTLEGYRAPVEASLEADFEEIYQHESFRQNLEVAALAELGAAVPVDEIAQAAILASSGAPVPLPNLDVGVKARAGGYFQSEIDRVFDDLRTRGAIRIRYVGTDATLQAAVQTAYTSLQAAVFEPAERLSSAARTAARGVSPRGTGDGNEKKEEPRADGGGIAKAGTSDAAAKKEEPPPDAKKGEKVDPDAAKLDAGGGAPTKSGADAAAMTAAQLADAERKAKASRTPAATASAATAPTVKPKDGRCAGFDAGGEQKGFAQLTLAVEACLTLKYQFKQTRQTGTYRLDLQRHTASTLRVPFAENIGDLRDHLANPAIFRSVRLDDPFYQQREISTTLNGIQLGDFGDVLSSVVVQLRKTHEGGATTVDEVKIDRAAFAKRGSDYKLRYGWKDDADRDLWLDYEYRVRWSFPGSPPLESEWLPGRFGVIDLDPPFRRRVIEIQGDADLVREHGVRSVTVRLHHEIGGGQRTKQVSLRASEGDLSSRIEILTPPASAYGYEILWRLKGNRTLSSGPRTTVEDVLYVDELPIEAPTP